MAKGIASVLYTSSDVGQTYATLEFSADGWTCPNDTTSSSGNAKNGSSTVTTYDDIEYSWVFGDGGTSSSESPTHTFTGLTAGAKNTCRGTVTVTCTKTVEKETWYTTYDKEQNGTDENGKPTYETVENLHTSTSSSSSTYRIGNATATAYVYTQPKSVTRNSGIATGKTIQTSNGLSATFWNKLVSAITALENWSNQNGKANYSKANASSGEIITAAKYNIVANALGVDEVQPGDLITADVFIALMDALEDYE